MDSNFELSFEFFPPRTAQQAEQLQRARAQLDRLSPSWYSVTFGAGGTTRQGTLNSVIELREQSQCEVAPHLSCGGLDVGEIDELLKTYRSLQVKRLVALRGDMVSGYGLMGDFAHANELVAHIRERTGSHFHIDVACYPEFHPEANTAGEDLERFCAKMRAGADGAVSQYFFNADAYFRFVDQVRDRGIDAPIVPGIMPISNVQQLSRFSAMCGAEIPRWLRWRMEELQDDRASLIDFGADFLADMCERLVDAGAPGLHIYTLNRSEATVKLCERLGR